MGGIVGYQDDSIGYAISIVGLCMRAEGEITVLHVPCMRDTVHLYCMGLAWGALYCMGIAWGALHGEVLPS